MKRKLHELAHARCEDHDARFIRELERLAGEGARLLADEGSALRARFELPGPHAGSTRGSDPRARR